MPDTRLIGLPARDTPPDRPQTATELDRMLAEIEIEPWSEEEATHWWRMHQPA